MIRRGSQSAGFTLVELLVFMGVGGVLVASIVGLLIAQQHDYSRQREIASDQRDLRVGLLFLASEIRGISPADGDLVTLGSQSVVLRSRRGSATVCKVLTGTASPTYRLARPSGEFLAESADSALFFLPNSATPADDAYRALKVEQASLPGPLGCDYPNSTKGRLLLEVSGDTSGITVGSAAFAFRHVEYGLFAYGAEWWLGQRVGGASTWEPLMGPLAAGATGLAFTYYDESGNVTANPGDVSAVDIRLRRPPRTGPEWLARPQGDSISSRVYIRN